MSQLEKVQVQFTEQQLVFLEKLRAEGKFGGTLEEVVRNVFREHVQAVLPKDRG